METTIKSGLMTVEEISEMVNKGRLSDRQFKVVLDSHGHGVWIWSKSRLRARFWQGATKFWKDQTPAFMEWIEGGCKGKCLPRQSSTIG